MRSEKEIKKVEKGKRLIYIYIYIKKKNTETHVCMCVHVSKVIVMRMLDDFDFFFFATFSSKKILMTPWQLIKKRVIQFG